MNVLDYFTSSVSLKEKVLDIKVEIENIVYAHCPEKFHVTWYGAYEIDPKYLVYWVCVQTDEVKKDLQQNVQLNEKLRRAFIKNQYPLSAQKHVHIGFESQETVDRESEGNWWYHFK